MEHGARFKNSLHARERSSVETCQISAKSRSTREKYQMTDRERERERKRERGGGVVLIERG